MHPPITRRRFIGGLVAGVALSATGAACSGDEDDDDAAGQTTTSTTAPVPDLPDGVFALGIASGDPLSSAVTLWTRLAPRPLEGGGMPAEPVPVRWEVANDENFTDVVADGVATAGPELAHSVHVNVEGLAPDTSYAYRFTAGDQTSPVGRTRTTPDDGADVDGLRFLFASCQDWRDGYWPAWRHAAEEDVDLIVFLGDYIYEGGPGDETSVRQHNSEEVTSLDGYRNRYGLYKGDEDLQAAHAAAPWISIWDDHEVENNHAGLVPQDAADAATFEARRNAAYQAYYEHHPMRVDPPDGGEVFLYRSVDWGRLVRFYLLDGRQYRTDQPCGDDLAEDCEARTADSATMLGTDQEAWLGERFTSSQATWNVLANQTIMSPTPIAGLFNTDQWDGYPAARTRLLGQITASDLANPVVITGDIHASGVGDLTDEAPDAPVVGTELVGTSISSGFPAALATVAADLIGGLPHVKWFDATERGYVTCEVTPERLTARYRVVSTTAERQAEISTRKTWVVEAGTLGATEA